MKLVRIIYPRNSRPCGGILMPLEVNSRRLTRMGIQVDLVEQCPQMWRNCDCLIFLSSCYSQEIRDDDHVYIIDEIQKARAVSHKVIWMDIGDSSGSTQFYVMPWVDVYAKSWLLKDRSMYFQQFYGNRVFTDYFHREFGIEDHSPVRMRPALKPADKNKLTLGWSVALADYGPWASYWAAAVARFNLPWVYTVQYGFSKTRCKRTHDVSMRVTSKYDFATVAYQRQILCDKFIGKKSNTEWLTLRDYFRELSSSKISVSPFGWGEACFRDFETFVAGGMLLKPDMSHIETWPDLYIPNETYVPFQWDCSDFDEILNYWLHNPRRVAIATEGQNRYWHYLFSRSGREEFCDRFINLVL